MRCRWGGWAGSSGNCRADEGSGNRCVDGLGWLWCGKEGESDGIWWGMTSTSSLTKIPTSLHLVYQFVRVHVILDVTEQHYHTCKGLYICIQLKLWQKLFSMCSLFLNSDRYWPNCVATKCRAILRLIMNGVINKHSQSFTTRPICKVLHINHKKSVDQFRAATTLYWGCDTQEWSSDGGFLFLSGAGLVNDPLLWHTGFMFYINLFYFLIWSRNNLFAWFLVLTTLWGSMGKLISFGKNGLLPPHTAPSKCLTWADAEVSWRHFKASSVIKYFWKLKVCSPVITVLVNSGFGSWKIPFSYHYQRL